MTYETVARFAQQGGTVYFLLIFLAGFAYAFWPRKTRRLRTRPPACPWTRRISHGVNAKSDPRPGP